jgi:REP element-mobilizing transposase RayT
VVPARRRRASATDRRLEHLDIAALTFGTRLAEVKAMSLPRRIVPGTKYMITRRCYQRTFRLRPSGNTNDIYLYSLAWAAAKTRVEIHAVCVMSNHHHIVLTDVHGRLPDFVRELHRTVAKALNAAQGEWENLWSAESYHALELGADEDVIDKIAYITANPTEAGLVESPEDWPGVMLLPEAEVRTRKIKRPPTYFTDGEVFPETVTLSVSPVVAKTPSDAHIFQRVAGAIQHALARARSAILACGRTYIGCAGVLSHSFRKRAESFEPRRGPIPRVRARNRPLLRAMLARSSVFWRSIERRSRPGGAGIGASCFRLAHGGCACFTAPGLLRRSGSCAYERKAQRFLRGHEHIAEGSGGLRRGVAAGRGVCAGAGGSRDPPC